MLGECDGTMQVSFEGSTYRTEDGNIERFLVGFMNGSLDGTEDRIFDGPVLRDRLGKEDG